MVRVTDPVPPEKTREVTSFLKIFCLLMPCSYCALTRGLPSAGTAERDIILLRPACPGLVTSLVFSAFRHGLQSRGRLSLARAPIYKMFTVALYNGEWRGVK